MMNFQITSGPLYTAKRILIYGVPGIGKTTLAAQFPGALFIDLEGSTDAYNVSRLPKPSSAEMLMEEIRYVRQAKPCQTLVIDTADWMEDLIRTKVLIKNKWESIETPGYGKGFNVLEEEFGRVLDELTKVSEAGINVVLNAHAEAKNIDLPDNLGSYMKWQPKLAKGNNKKIMEWSEAIFFLNYSINIINVDNKGQIKGKNKAQGEPQRYIYAQPNAAWEAKNRIGLPAAMPLSYESIRPLIEPPQQQTAMQNAPVAREARMDGGDMQGVTRAADASQATAAGMTQAAQVNTVNTAAASMPQAMSQPSATPAASQAAAASMPPEALSSSAAPPGTAQAVQASAVPPTKTAQDAASLAKLQKEIADSEALKQMPDNIKQLLASTWSEDQHSLKLLPDHIVAWAAVQGWFPANMPPEFLPPDFLNWLANAGWMQFMEWAAMQSGVKSIPFN